MERGGGGGNFIYLFIYFLDEIGFYFGPLLHLILQPSPPTPFPSHRVKIEVI